MGTTTTATKAPSCAGAFAVRGTDVGGDVMAAVLGYAVGGAMAHTTAPVRGTGLPIFVEQRLRPLGLEAGRRGWAQTAVVATDDQLNSDTPGDLPPRDPLS